LLRVTVPFTSEDKTSEDTKQVLKCFGFSVKTRATWQV